MAKEDLEAIGQDELEALEKKKASMEEATRAAVAEIEAKKERLNEMRRPFHLLEQQRTLLIDRIERVKKGLPHLELLASEWDQNVDRHFCSNDGRS